MHGFFGFSGCGDSAQEEKTLSSKGTIPTDGLPGAPTCIVVKVSTAGFGSEVRCADASELVASDLAGSARTIKASAPSSNGRATRVFRDGSRAAFEGMRRHRPADRKPLAAEP